MARRLGDTAQFLVRKAQGQLIKQKGTKMLHAVTPLSSRPVFPKVWVHGKFLNRVPREGLGTSEM